MAYGKRNKFRRIIDLSTNTGQEQVAYFCYHRHNHQKDWEELVHPTFEVFGPPMCRSPNFPDPVLLKLLQCAYVSLSLFKNGC